MNARLDHLNLTVTNFAVSVDWYRRIFGFELVEQGMDELGPWGILRSEDSMLCIYERAERTAAPTWGPGLSERFHRIYHFGLRIRDRARWEEILRQEELKTFYASPVAYPHSTSWYIKDPSGHMVEVALWKNDQVKFLE